jgi:hypothetical protein
MAKHITKTLHLRVLDLIELSDIEKREPSPPTSVDFSLEDVV